MFHNKSSKWRATFIRKSNLFWWMWLVQSVFERVGVIGRLTVRHCGNPTQFSHVNWCEKFQAWIWCEIFHTWNRCEFSIRHVQPCSTCEILNLHTFQTCFWCESGMKQAWSYENILYGSWHHVHYRMCLYRRIKTTRLGCCRLAD